MRLRLRLRGLGLKRLGRLRERGRLNRLLLSLLLLGALFALRLLAPLRAA